MTEIDINNLSASLHIVNELITKYVKERKLSFDEKLKIMYFFRDYGEMESFFIQEEIRLSDVSNAPIKVAVAQEIFKESQSFLTLYKENKSILDRFEVKTDCENYLAPYVHNWESSNEYSQKVHQEYIDLDNRVSYMDERDPEYTILLKRCYELFDQQKEASRIAQNYNIELRNARLKLYGLENFNFKWLFLLVSQLSDIIKELFPDIKTVN